MAKFNITVDLDWMDDEEGYSIDDELKERVIKGIEDTLLKRATDDAVKAVDDKIREKVGEAENSIQEAVDKFISTVCEEKINKIMIPVKKNSWSGEVKYKPLSEYVGERFNYYITEKKFDKDGNVARWSSESVYSAADLLTSDYLKKELDTKVETMISNARKEVEESLIKSFEQKLKENLSKDIIEKMNIPDVLRRFSEMSLE
ncbi:hypothetical protein DW272_02250 [Blautia obeum]|uniref:Uncharacterized protein n=1 Tax=Blautia obeum TaxID=40520 RepID=A0A414SKF2_9FIRM|nr:hypothetical protein [Blautia obeum]RHG20047.1 hypothetical protein DW272_02250 [Blautia obeum]